MCMFSVIALSNVSRNKCMESTNAFPFLEHFTNVTLHKMCFKENVEEEIISSRVPKMPKQKKK